ncbi:MAG: AAA family ATPase [Opitutales bacterium]|nr:AAA family ATPase [Opitutales bacterium]
MKIKVENLGVISSAEVDLSSRITLLCGPNNTGKTYLSYVLYALLRGQRAVIRETPEVTEKFTPLFSEEKKVRVELPIDEICRRKAELAEKVRMELDSVFGISESDSKAFLAKTQISFSHTRLEVTEHLSGMIFSDVLSVDGFTISMKKDAGSLAVAFEVVSESVVPENASRISFARISAFLNTVMVFKGATYPITNVVMFPVERNSIYTFNKELSLTRNELIDRIQAFGKGEAIDPFALVDRSTKRYPKAIRDCLEVAGDLTNIQKRTSEYVGIANALEASLLKGKLSVSKDGDVQFLVGRGKRIPIQMTASIVKTLSSFVIYLKHLARRGDLVIIDEPEMNLHPSSQILLARIFARLANSGLRFLISTHSDYIVREFGALVMISSSKDSVKAQAKELGYEEQESVRREDFAVYAFNVKSSNKVCVEKLNVYENGVSVANMNSAILEQNERVESLFEELYYGE